MMENRKKKKMKPTPILKKYKITLTVVLLGLIILGLYMYWKNNRPSDYFIYEHLDETVITIDHTIEINLQEVAYYIMDIEGYVNQQALIYNEDDPADYWNTHFSAGLDSAFVYSMAKQQVYETCLTDYLYEIAAMENDYTLSENQMIIAKSEGIDIYNNMTEKQKEATGLTLEQIQTMRIREALATSYALYIIENYDWESTIFEPSNQVVYGGDYFNQMILGDHEIQLNEDVWDNIVLGKITVN